MRIRFGSLVLVTLLLAASNVRAAECNPGQSAFTDVPDNAIFCNDALWLRNALVTLGCGNGTTYCPSDPVSRAQMALFMRRLATAATPDIVFSDTAATSGDLDAGGFETCTTAPYTMPPTANARIMGHAIGTVSILTDAAADLLVQIQVKIDDGLYQTFAGFMPRVQVPANQWTVVPVIGGYTILGNQGLNMIPGSTFTWRIFLQREGAGATGDITSNRCQLLINLPMQSAF